jgi:ribosome-binding protein aMBF1 (putative translation factor)
MTAKQYQAARRALEWSHALLAETIGKSTRTSFRYASGEIEIPDTVAKLVRRLVSDRLTMSNRKFDEMLHTL